MSAAITFVLSFILLLAFIVFRFYEEKRGVRVFAPARKVADEIVSDMYKSAVMGGIPERYRFALFRFLHTLAHDSVVFLLESLRAIERPLTRLSYRMRQSAPSANGREPSEFLKELTSEKKKTNANRTRPPPEV